MDAARGPGYVQESGEEGHTLAPGTCSVRTRKRKAQHFELNIFGVNEKS
jgi:hypothetical protein